MTWVLLGNGCDKKFYVESGSAGGYGAICCSDDVAARETKAYIDLKTLGLTVLPTILPWTDRNGISVDGQTLKPQYLIERLVIGRTFKPQMCSLGVLPAARAELRRGNAARLRDGLAEIAANLEAICRIVGELTLAVDGTSGSLYMLDFSPAQNGNRAIGQLETIRRGMVNLQAGLG